MTAACWDTGGCMNTAAALVTARGTVTPTLVTAFLGESQGLTPRPHLLMLDSSEVSLRWSAFWVINAKWCSASYRYWLCGTAQTCTPSMQPLAMQGSAATAAMGGSSGQRSFSLHCTTPVSHRSQRTQYPHLINPQATAGVFIWGAGSTAPSSVLWGCH